MRLLSLVLLLLLAAPAAAQPASSEVSAHAVPFASEGNVLELAVANTGPAALGAVRVAAVQTPTWLALSSEEQTLENLAPGEEATASFSFDVLPSAPVGDVAVLRFAFHANGAAVGEKLIRLRVEAPEAAALLANYPNPFNPQTTIAFVLPEASHARLAVYNVLGQEAAVLAEGAHPAGRHEALWEASRFASGLFFTVLRVEGEAGQQVFRRTMLLVK